MSSFNLQHILHGDYRQLDELFATIAHAQQLTTTEVRHQCATQMFDRLFADDHVDNQIRVLVAQLEPLFIAQCLTSDHFYSDANHHARQFFDGILNDGSHWYPNDTTPNSLYFNQLAQLVRLAQQTWGGDPLQTATFIVALQEFQQTRAAEHQRATRLETRLCEAEITAAATKPQIITDHRTTITPAVMQQSAAIEQGDWLIFRTESGVDMRCKLALDNRATNQLLYVDRNGHKVMGKTTQDIALCMSTGIARTLPRHTVLDAIKAQLASYIIQAHQAQEQALSQATLKAAQLIQALDKQQKTAAEQKRRREQQIAIQLDLRRTAARKALAEARALAETKIQQDMQQKLAQYQREHEQKMIRAEAGILQQHSAQQTMDELQVGAWVELTRNGSKVRSKLSVILAATGKYIFVDQSGRKVAEHQREELIQLLAEEHARIIHKGDNFEDRLETMIRSLRRTTS